MHSGFTKYTCIGTVLACQDLMFRRFLEIKTIHNTSLPLNQLYTKTHYKNLLPLCNCKVKGKKDTTENSINIKELKASCQTARTCHKIQIDPAPVPGASIQIVKTNQCNQPMGLSQ